VGFATWTDADGVTELEDLFVDPDWTRRGIATALVKGIADIMRARDVEQPEVTAKPSRNGLLHRHRIHKLWHRQHRVRPIAPHGADDSLMLPGART
jgi:GNAT superfamily N-acetyltransferase